MDEAGENSSLSTHTYKFLDNDYDKKAQVFLSQPHDKHISCQLE